MVGLMEDLDRVFSGMGFAVYAVESMFARDGVSTLRRFERLALLRSSLLGIPRSLKFTIIPLSGKLANLILALGDHPKPAIRDHLKTGQ